MSIYVHVCGRGCVNDKYRGVTEFLFSYNNHTKVTLLEV